MNTAGDVLSKKSIADNFINPGAKVIEALNKLNEINLSYLIVKDGDEVSGIFSEKDYARKVILKGRSSSQATVGEVMSTDIPVVDASESVEHCMHLLASHGQRYIIVKDQDDFTGVITIHDMLREILLHVDSGFDGDIARALIELNELPPKIY